MLPLPSRFRLAALVVLVLACALPRSASAQDARRNTYRITISEDANVCRYLVEYRDEAGNRVPQTDQKRFTVSPGSRLFFRTSGTGLGGAEVSVGDGGGLSGTDGAASVSLDPGERKKLVARKHAPSDDAQTDTQHRVNIVCCSGFSLFGTCQDPVRAGCQRNADGSETCPAPAVEPEMETGGPSMEVDEDP